METIFLSKCCKEKAVQDEKDDGTPIFTCMKCERDCEAEEVCAFCLGTGEIVVDEQVYPGEPHYAPIGTRECICKKIEREESRADDALQDRD